MTSNSQMTVFVDVSSLYLCTFHISVGVNGIRFTCIEITSFTHFTNFTYIDQCNSEQLRAAHTIHGTHATNKQTQQPNKQHS